jgi:membrane fusion protein, multidrug efflux system
MNEPSPTPSSVEPVFPPRDPLRPQGNGRRWTIAVIVVLLLIAVIAWIVHHGQQAQVPGGFGGPGGPGGSGAAGGRSGGGPVAVAMATAVSGDIQVRIPALGTVTPTATVTVKTQISGQLQQIAFKEGQVVRQGEFLAQIDPRPYQAALQQAQGNLARDAAQLANARLDLKRYQDLIRTNLVAQQQLDAQAALVAQLEGTIVGDTAQVNAAKLNLQYAHIVSPVAGRAGLRQVDQGNYVTPGDPNGIVVVTELQPITVIFPIPEDNVSAVMKRFRQGEALEVDAYDRANTTLLARGRLITVDNVIDTTTGTVKLRAHFDNQDYALFPNQFVNIQLLLQTEKDQVVIPVAAVQHGAPNGVNSTFVYRINADRSVSVVPIALGVVDGERVAVRRGLKPGDRVVTEGGDRLRDGAQVLLPAADSAGGGRGAGGNGSGPAGTAAP